MDNNNKYYEEQQKLIKELVLKNEFEKAQKLIDEELSMPYIPSKFEAFLLEQLNKIPLSNRSDNYSLSLDKVIDLLIKLDQTNNDLSDIIKSLSKFNLVNETEELEYYFNKSSNKRNRAMVFELLINMKVDLECQLGNPINSKSILELPDYIEDSLRIENKLQEYPNFIELSIELLKEIYLTKHIGQELEGGYSDMVILTVGRILEEDNLIELVTDIESVTEKMKSFKSFENLTNV